VGEVKKIQWDREAGKAVVIMDIKSDYRNSITEGSRVTLRRKGVLGDRYVVIEPEKPSARKLKPGEEIPIVHEGIEPEETMENFGVASQDIRVLAEESRKQMVDQKSLEKLSSVIENSNKFFADANKLVSENRERINATLKDHRDAARKLDQLLDKNKDKLNRTVDQAERASGNMDKAADDMEKITRDVRSGRGTLGKLVSEDSLHRDASALVNELRQLSNRIQYGPGSVSRIINDPELYYEARRAIRNMNKTAEDVSEATPVSTLATILGAVLK
jgi:phospholipid/cholesterol/gamma-HCH transport system substrate-binding protein